MSLANGALRVLCIVVLLMAATASPPVDYSKRNSEAQYNYLQKRPFCNAFTGCGRKRSASAAMNGGAAESMGAVMPSYNPDRMAELEELYRHILAEARLWEQLQRKVEILRSVAETGPLDADATTYNRRKRGTLVSSHPRVQSHGRQDYFRTAVEQKNVSEEDDQQQQTQQDEDHSPAS